MQICFCIFLLKLKSYRSQCHVNNFRHASKTPLKYNVSGRFVKSPTQDLFVMKELPFKRESVNLLDSFRVHDEQLVMKSDASYKLWSPLILGYPEAALQLWVIYLLCTIHSTTIGCYISWGSIILSPIIIFDCYALKQNRYIRN